MAANVVRRYLLAVACLAGCATTRATVVGTIHAEHFVQAAYPMSTLDDVIERVRPDLVLVEVRPEPFARGELEDGPAEMTYVTLRARARGIAVEPIDWWIDAQVGAAEPAPSSDACRRELEALAKKRVWPPSYDQANGPEQMRVILALKELRVRCLDGDAAWVERQGYFHALADRAIDAHRARRVLAFVGQEHAPQLAQHLTKRARVVPVPRLTSFESRPAPDDVIEAWRAGAARMQAKLDDAPANLRATYARKSRLWRFEAEHRGVCCAAPDAP